jgi:hypothetical protein
MRDGGGVHHRTRDRYGPCSYAVNNRSIQLLIVHRSPVLLLSYYPFT